MKTMTYFAIIVTAGLIAMPALADFSGNPDPVHLSRVSGYYQGNGGEFTIQPQQRMDVIVGGVSDINDSSWQTFCIERSEHVTPPATYYADINTFSIGGGVSGQDGFNDTIGSATDSLDPRTAYLYQNFRNGTLDRSYNYTPGSGRRNHAGALQNAIWYIEGEVNNINGLAAEYYNEAVEATEIGSLIGNGNTDGVPTWVGLGNVRVMNMWGNIARTIFRQDQLVLVPAPGAALLATIGLAAAWIRRRTA